MNKPSHEEISQRAHRLWQDSGSSGRDATQNWLDAERELTAAASQPPASPPAAQHAAAQPLSEAKSPQAKIERASQQKKTAREPKFPTHTGPKTVPAETGKPLWNQPHSS